MSKEDPPLIRAVKDKARKLKKEQPDLTHSQALEAVVRKAGFKTYAALRAAIKSLA